MILRPLLLLLLLLAGLVQSQNEERCTFLLVVMDESGSMEAEREFLRNEAMEEVINDLRVQLEGTIFACSWGFGWRGGRGQPFPLDGHLVGCSVGFDSSNYDFAASGGIEDGYAAIRSANNYVQTLIDEDRPIDGQRLSECTDYTNFVLIFASDEDRDAFFGGLSRESTLQLLQQFGWTTHMLLDNPILSRNAIGAKQDSANQYTVYEPNLNADGTSYRELVVSFDPVGRGPGKPDYWSLAYDTDGVVWDLRQLRQGGFIAEAFKEAFVDETVETVVEQVTSPEPSMAPSPGPSPEPSPGPTKFPSPAPSKDPTEMPVPAPSSNPTEVPMPTISSNPTETPTTEFPTPEPSAAPSPSPSAAPSPGPTADPSPAPSSAPIITDAPISAAPTVTPDVCTAMFVLPCIQNGSESTFRAVLRIFLNTVLNNDEMDVLIPPLGDAFMTEAIQFEIQDQMCDYLNDPEGYDLLDGGVDLARAFIANRSFTEISDFARDFVDLFAENVDISTGRAAALVRDLIVVFTGDFEDLFVTQPLNRLAESLQDMAECLGSSIDLPPIPAPAPPSDSGGLPTLITIFGFDIPVCFSGNTLCDVEGRGWVRMEDVSIGDAVRVADGSYETVYSFGHRQPYYQSMTQYVEISHQGSDAPIEMSPDHLLYKVGGNTTATPVLVRADAIAPGDVLWTIHDGSYVTHVKKVYPLGAYAPFTASGTIVVNGGVVASNFIALPGRAFRAVSLQFQQQLHRWFNAPYRWYCGSGCLDEVYDPQGYSTNARFLLEAYGVVEWLVGSDWLVTATVLGLSVMWGMRAHVLQK